MWDRITEPEAYHNIVKAIDSSTDDEKTKQCIADGVARKEAKCFRYTEDDFSMILYVYKNFTHNYWVFNYAISSVYDVTSVAQIIIQRIRVFMDTTDSDEFRIQVTTQADPRIIQWIKNTTNVSEYQPELENTKYNEQHFRIGAK